MFVRVLAILLLSMLSANLACAQRDDEPQEYLIKAKYLLNIPLFAGLPLSAIGDASYTICLTGDTFLEGVLQSSQGMVINSRPLVIRRVADLCQGDGCRMLFIASSERHRLQALLPMAQLLGVLTISDMPDFARLGGMVSLLSVDNRITFDLNLAAARTANISFSSHLIKLAHNIIN